MGYINGSQIDSELARTECNLLQAGFSYTEIAKTTGNRIKTISERNRLIYKIDIWEAFQRRIKLNGIPNRLSISDNFGYWFSGFFDGEGTITAFSRVATDPRYREYRLSIRIMLRDDDADVITRIYNNLKIGNISRHKQKGNTKPAIAWCVERIKDLTEIIIPLFDNYSLYSKKAKEYSIWKPLVIQRYITTLGGYSNRKGIPKTERTQFLQGIELIKQIRSYGH